MTHRIRTVLLLLFAFPAFAAEPADGIRPVGADGKSLNLDFETGDLRDWTAVGEAFKGQPVKGDTVSPRRGDMKSEHQGQFWVGTYERAGDRPQGTLTSAAFKVTHPWASFLVAGGPWPETCVEVILKDGDRLVARVSGLEEENLKRVAVDLRPHAGKEIYVRLVDKHAGHWGHLNFDDFRFHSAKPNLPERKTAQPLPAPDQYQYAGLPPKKAAEVMTVPEGFKVTLFAGEPDVQQPIAMCLDDRGRLWVAEAYVYPRRLPFDGPLLPEAERKRGDRILIFEDADGDGVFDKRTVFMEGLNLVSGLEVGFGGVWIGAAPYLLYVPMKEVARSGDRATTTVPAGAPQILLDGWHYEDTHETLNSFIWGPDGWLYGCHGVFTHSGVGKPGTPDKDRTPINAGVWRYHPTRHVFEVFAHGTSNPWGLDFNEHGEAFVEACVIPHLFHIIQGGRYQRQAGQHFNPYTYADIQTIADHRHYAGPNPHGGNNRSDSMGGGHAHCGLMCYLGGTWPKEYQGRLFMGNIHGRRINTDILKPSGSGYVASHGPDFLLANDAWARFINMRYGPDGNVYLFDWYDKQACHLTQPEVWDRSNGRIYKISYRGTKPVTVDLSKLGNYELVEMMEHKNDWYVRHARRILHERFAQATRDKPLDPAEAPSWSFRGSLRFLLGHQEEMVRLRAMWALHCCGGLAPGDLKRLLGDQSPHIRGWTVRLALEGGQEILRTGLVRYPKADASLSTPELFARLHTEELERLINDPSPVVRRHLASGMQRLSLDTRRGFVKDLGKHRKDVNDPNLPFLYWYAAEPIGTGDPGDAMHMASHSAVPPTLAFMARRLASTGKPEAIEAVVDRLETTDDDAKQRLILQGLSAGLQGQRDLKMPPTWPAAKAKLLNSKDNDIRTITMSVAVAFGDAAALDALRKSLTDLSQPVSARRGALETLLAARDDKLPATLRLLLADADLRAAVLRAMAAYDDPLSAELIVAAYPTFSAAEKRDAVATLAARGSYARRLLKAIGDKKVPAADVTADIVRQLGNLRDADIDQQIAAVWGIVRKTPADRLRLMREYRNKIVSGGPAPDLLLGRTLYAKTCQSCHSLFAVGGKVGPDITGANRGDLNYLLENVLDPSAVIPKEYVATRIDLKNGRTVTGIVKEKNANTLTVVTATETLTIARSDVDDLAESNVSMMPDDQLKPFSDHEVRSLFAYLQSPVQTPMLATAENAKELFNGKDLTGWDGDPKLWSVQNGEIVGKSPGIRHNAFLTSHLAAADFTLTLKVKLTPNKENSGIQFRSAPVAGGEMRGPQADAGAGWWGKLYEENGRGLLWDKSGEQHVNRDGWNDYKIEAVGPRVRTWINGQLCVDLTDEKLARRGIFGLQIHSGGPMEVRFKELKLEVK